MFQNLHSELILAKLDESLRMCNAFVGTQTWILMMDDGLHGSYYCYLPL